VESQFHPTLGHAEERRSHGKVILLKALASAVIRTRSHGVFHDIALPNLADQGALSFSRPVLIESAHVPQFDF
jgi:hypothetical protein